tara:strand:- start:114 stop:1052 length:939 start_codon:yes stop_codon:yes gene_type:complete
MAYIGKPPASGAYEKQTITADGSTTTFTLNFTIGSSSSLIVSVAGVVQEPEVGYSLAAGGTQIVFSAAPTSGVTVYVVFLGIARDVDNIASSGIITNKTELAETAADNDLLLLFDTSASVLKKVQKQYVGVNINTTTALAEEPASGDKFLVYDTSAGANRAVEYQYINPSLTYTNGTATGDGSDTTFTINSGRSVNDVIVSVNGFILVPTDDYSISGTTLTFVTAPVNGGEISIRYLPLAGTASYTNSKFTGDGSTTTQTISSGRSVEDVIVSVNGVLLVPSDDYSISGTTLTFATAPAASAEISVRFLRLT